MLHNLLNDFQIGFILTKSCTKGMPEIMRTKMWYQNRLTMFFLRLYLFLLITSRINVFNGSVYRLWVMYISTPIWKIKPEYPSIIVELNPCFICCFFSCNNALPTASNIGTILFHNSVLGVVICISHLPSSCCRYIKLSFLTHRHTNQWNYFSIIYCKVKPVISISKKHTIISSSPYSCLIYIVFLICTGIIIIFQIFCTCWLFSFF